MKKLDKLVFGSFIGPFVLTLIVVDFILLLVALLKYFDQIMGKGLGFDVFAELIFYFSVSSSPDAFPLAILLSSIMAFGNLGEHSELTAVKSSGISLVRALLPIFIFVLALTGFTYYSNTRLVPKVNLKTYSLLWDMRTKKPALDIRQGVFYSGIPGYSIKINEKIDDENLKDIIIYDHTATKNGGNKTVILADSGRMYSFMNQRYLALELYNGRRYLDRSKNDFKSKANGGDFVRDRFGSSRIVFDLSSFDMNDTDERLFKRSRLVQTRADLIVGIDSMKRSLLAQKARLFKDVGNTFRYHFLRGSEAPRKVLDEKERYDSIRRERLTKTDSTVRKKKLAKDADRKVKPKVEEPPLLNKKAKLTDNSTRKGLVGEGETSLETLDSIFTSRSKLSNAYASAQNNARTARNLVNGKLKQIKELERNKNKFFLTKNQQMARSFACLVMFLIGAPIGAIIKKGGLGLPVIVSVIFFLIFYILNTTSEKWGKEGVMNPSVVVWISNAVLLPFGLFFLRKARNDARLFESDVYAIWWAKVKAFFQRKKSLTTD